MQFLANEWQRLPHQSWSENTNTTKAQKRYRIEGRHNTKKANSQEPSAGKSPHRSIVTIGQNPTHQTKRSFTTYEPTTTSDTGAATTANTLKKILRIMHPITHIDTTNNANNPTAGSVCEETTPLQARIQSLTTNDAN